MQRSAPWILAVLAGAALALAMPGPGLWPLVLLFPGLLLEAVERSGGGWRPWLLGWLAGVVHWAIATYWVLEVMHHYGSLPWPAAVGALVGMAAILACTWMIAAGLSSKLPPSWRIWFFPAVWVAVDAVRRFPPIQFPWNDVTAVFAGAPPLLGSLPVWGASGLGWAAVAVGTALWGLLRVERRAVSSALVLVAVGLAVAFGATAPAAAPGGRPIRVAVLQPGTSLEQKWDPAEWEEIADRVWSLTRAAADAGAELVLWPESAVPFRIDTDPAYRRMVRELAAELDLEIVLNSVGAMAGGGFANSAYLVTADGVAPVRYDKVHLVPFGEYVPAWAELAFSDALVREVGRFIPGEAVTPLPATVPLGVAICYEVVFPGHSAAAVRAGAEILVTLTNDGWYGFSWAPPQHFAQVVLRAAEERRWFARAALTGISGFVDPGGRVRSRLAVGEQGLLVADLQPIRTRTPRASWGDWWAVLCAIAAAVMLVSGRKRRSTDVSG